MTPDLNIIPPDIQQAMDANLFQSHQIKNEMEDKIITKMEHYDTEEGKALHFLAHNRKLPSDHGEHFPISQPNNTSYSCDKCDKSFACPGSLPRHKKSAHSDRKPFVCSICGKSFLRMDSLQFHSAVHSNVKRYSCRFCDLEFKTKHGCRLHIKTKHENKFPSKTSLKSHEALNTGINIKLFKCNKCDKFFREKRLLENHKKKHEKSKKHSHLLSESKVKNVEVAMYNLPLNKVYHGTNSPKICLKPVFVDLERIRLNSNDFQDMEADIEDTNQEFTELETENLCIKVDLDDVLDSVVLNSDVLDSNVLDCDEEYEVDYKARGLYFTFL